MKKIMKEYLEKTEKYLNENLIPFWGERAVEPKFGAFKQTMTVMECVQK